MNKLKLNPSSITFLPILVCIPLAYELFINFHIGGIELFKEFIISALNPKINNEIIFSLLKRLSETIFIVEHPTQNFKLNHKSNMTDIAPTVLDFIGISSTKFDCEKDGQSILE